MASVGANQKSAEWVLGAGEEFRFEVDFKHTIEIKLKHGHAEYFGAELGREASYSFSGENGVVFSWEGCTLTVIGECQSAYVAGETPMDSCINVHMALQQLRVQARSDSANGPRVIIVGPDDSGKTSLARTLINYAVRMGETPLYVDLDPMDASVTVPGTVSVTPMSKTVDIETGFMSYAMSSSAGPPDTPLVWQFGHEQPTDNAELFNLLVDRMAAAIGRHTANNSQSATSGLFVDTRGFTDAAKCETIDHAISALGITTLLVVGSERMYSLLSNRPFAKEGVTVIKMARSGGTVDRSAMFRQQYNSRIIQQYFYGTPKEPFSSFSTVANFQEIRILRVGEDSIAPSSTLPLGETRMLTDTSVLAVEPDEALTHSILAVTDASMDLEGDSVAGMQALGFVNVTVVDMEKKRLILISPVPGRLPKQVLLYDVESLRSALPTDMHSKEIIFIPINNSNSFVHVEGGSGSHWSLLIYVKHVNPTYHYYDSMANINYQYALAVKSKLDAILFGAGSQGPPMITHSCPQQENGSDCGIFVILYTDLLARRYNDLRLPPPIQPTNRVSMPPPVPPRPRRLRKFSAEPDTTRHAASIALHNRRNSSQPQSSSLPTRPSTYHDSSDDSSGVIRRPMSPFVRSSNTRNRMAVRPAMLVAPVIERAFWWIDYADLCNPLKARTTLQALVNEHCTRYNNIATSLN
ncbi:Cleavage polyadenylation factor subunit clp1 [Coemansia pectinata]|uniref:Polynucleotide 5'-hydroxyl-kinase GRC3 n=1 Tax=Coemansia pectinata TaxID=1052879 RepID=A0A9W8H2Y6_9FUNG|nr:Cleavage polyadenylation factor subunit clp1 [Coemansia pectinata]